MAYRVTATVTYDYDDTYSLDEALDDMRYGLVNQVFTADEFEIEVHDA